MSRIFYTKRRPLAYHIYMMDRLTLLLDLYQPRQPEEQMRLNRNPAVQASLIWMHLVLDQYNRLD